MHSQHSSVLYAQQQKQQQLKLCEQRKKNVARDLNLFLFSRIVLIVAGFQAMRQHPEVSFFLHPM